MTMHAFSNMADASYQEWDNGQCCYKAEQITRIEKHKKKLKLYCWKSYYRYKKLVSVYRLLDVFKGGLDPSMRDEEQYKICDSIIKTRREMCCRNIEKNE